MKCEFDKAWKSDPALKALVQSLESAGGVAYLVGGCVRNTILGKPFTDIDIATDLLPEQVVSISKKQTKAKSKFFTDPWSSVQKILLKLCQDRKSVV